jgi:hypothetical protein
MPCREASASAVAASQTGEHANGRPTVDQTFVRPVAAPLRPLVVRIQAAGSGDGSNRLFVLTSRPTRLSLSARRALLRTYSVEVFSHHATKKVTTRPVCLGSNNLPTMIGSRPERFWTMPISSKIFRLIARRVASRITGLTA